MSVRTTDKNPKGFGINKVLDSHSLEFLSTQRTGGGTNFKPLPTPYRYIKWVITDLKNFASAAGVQASEFRLRIVGSNISMSGATVTNPGGSNPGAEGPEKLVDGNTGTKMFDSNIKSSPFTSTVIFDMGSPIAFDGYQWATANDATERDPKSWTISGSNDDVSYVTLHTVTGFTATTSRLTYQTPETFY